MRKLALFYAAVGFGTAVACHVSVPPTTPVTPITSNATAVIRVHVYDGDPAFKRVIPNASVTIAPDCTVAPTFVGSSLMTLVTDASGTASCTVVGVRARTVSVSAEGYGAFTGPLAGSEVDLGLLRLAPLAIHVEGDHFVDATGQRWIWKGATDFLLFKRYLDHENIDPLLDQRQAAGANLVRVFAMCQNLAHFNPVEYAQGTSWYWDGLVEFVDKLGARGLYVEVTVFADAQLVMPDAGQQLAHWRGFSRLAGKPNIFLDLVNEVDHVGNAIDTNRFAPIEDLLVSHGSKQTDEHPVEPLWTYATYHARRDGPPSAKGATNYDPYEFEAIVPRRPPYVADEGAKPADYANDPAFADLMGRHAALAAGGTFHSAAGVVSALWSDAELACATAFFRAMR